jgi:aspartate aminotransferase
VSSDEVVVVPGGKPIIFFTILALIDAGDEVIYPNPGFPIYESMINYSTGQGGPIPLREERDFSVDVKELASLISDRTKLIILNSPHNPTGGVLTKKDISKLPRPSATATSWFCRTKSTAASFSRASTSPS